MIVGCYTLDVYCDSPTCKIPHHETPDQFTAQSGEKCRQQARRKGWKLNLTNQTAICRECQHD